MCVFFSEQTYEQKRNQKQKTRKEPRRKISVSNYKWLMIKYNIVSLNLKFKGSQQSIWGFGWWWWTPIYPKFKEATLDFSCVKTINLKQHSLFFTQMKNSSALADCQSLKKTYYLILFLGGGGSSQNTGAFTIGIYRELSFSSK